jgi:hypothetical protein
MKRLKQNLYTTCSNQKARDIKTSSSPNPLDKAITLDVLIQENFEKEHFRFIIDDMLGAAIPYTLIQKHDITYFSYLESNMEDLGYERVDTQLLWL